MFPSPPIAMPCHRSLPRRPQDLCCRVQLTSAVRSPGTHPPEFQVHTPEDLWWMTEMTNSEVCSLFEDIEQVLPTVIFTFWSSQWYQVICLSRAVGSLFPGLHQDWVEGDCWLGKKPEMCATNHVMLTQHHQFFDNGIGVIKLDCIPKSLPPWVQWRIDEKW